MMASARSAINSPNPSRMLSPVAASAAHSTDFSRSWAGGSTGSQAWLDHGGGGGCDAAQLASYLAAATQPGGSLQGRGEGQSIAAAAAAALAASKTPAMHLGLFDSDSDSSVCDSDSSGPTERPVIGDIPRSRLQRLTSTAAAAATHAAREADAQKGAAATAAAAAAVEPRVAAAGLMPQGEGALPNAELSPPPRHTFSPSVKRQLWEASLEAGITDSPLTGSAATPAMEPSVPTAAAISVGNPRKKLSIRIPTANAKTNRGAAAELTEEEAAAPGVPSSAAVPEAVLGGGAASELAAPLLQQPSRIPRAPGTAVARPADSGSGGPGTARSGGASNPGGDTAAAASNEGHIMAAAIGGSHAVGDDGACKCYKFGVLPFGR